MLVKRWLWFLCGPGRVLDGLALRPDATLGYARVLSGVNTRLLCGLGRVEADEAKLATLALARAHDAHISDVRVAAGGEVCAQALLVSLCRV